MKLTKLGVSATLLAVLASVAACGSGASTGAGGSTGGSSSAGGSSAAPSVPIQFGYQETTWGAPIMVAQKMNAWQGDGVQVQTTTLSSGTDVVQGLLANSLDAGSLGSAPLIIGASKGSLVAVAVVAYAGKTDAVVVRKGSGITSLAGLRGKKIASQYGSSTDAIFNSKIAPAAGLSKNDYQLVNTQFQDMVAALQTGQVDAFAGVDPSPQMAVYDHIGTILTTYQSYDPTPLYITFTRSFVQQHPQEVVDFLKGWLKVVHEFRTNPGGAAQLSSAVFEKHGVTIPGPVMTASIKDFTMTPAFAANTDQYLTQQAKYLQKEGAIQSIPNWSTVIDSKFLQEAEKSVNGG